LGGSESEPKTTRPQGMPAAGGVFVVLLEPCGSKDIPWRDLGGF